MGLRTWLGLKKKRAVTEPTRPHFWSEHSYAQLNQDRWVLSECGNKTGGFFVEIGAFDPRKLSNTYLLESEYGWMGILVEPNPALTEAIRNGRTSALCAQPVDAVSGKQVSMRFIHANPEYSSMASHAYNDALASLRRKKSVEVVQTTISLNDLLATYGAPTDIDFISIDTEGNEREILSTFAFDRYNVRLMCIEHNFTDANTELDEIMTSRGYERVHREWSRFDAWYRKK